jgi:hypothetical protein
MLAAIVARVPVEASLRSDSGGVGNLSKTEFADATIRHVDTMLALGIVLLPAYHASRPLGGIDEALFRHLAVSTPFESFLNRQRAMVRLDRVVVHESTLFVCARHTRVEVNENAGVPGRVSQCESALPPAWRY